MPVFIKFFIFAFTKSPETGILFCFISIRRINYVENSFTFRKPGGQTTNLTLVKEIVDINSVLYSDVIEVGGKKAQGLLGKKVGDLVSVKVPLGEVGFEILGISV